MIAKGFMGEFERDLDAVTDDLKKMLLEKNFKYGDSVLNPTRVFCKASPLDLLDARMDDKLSRIKMGSADDEDPYEDLTGYLILRMIYKKREKEKRNAS